MLRVLGRTILILLAAGLVAGGLYLAVDRLGANALGALGPGRELGMHGEGNRPPPSGSDPAQGGPAARAPGGRRGGAALAGQNPNGADASTVPADTTGLRPERPAGVGREGRSVEAGAWQRALSDLLRDVAMVAGITLVIVPTRWVIRWVSRKRRMAAILRPAD